MSKKFEAKKEVVVEITKKFEKAQSVIFVKYDGLTVEQATKLRAQCREAGVEYCVLKNRLVKLALNGLDNHDFDDVLTGPSAFAFGMEDAVSPAKVLVDFIKKEKTEAIQIKSGMLDGKLMDMETINTLATIPSREVLLARLLGSLNATIASFARVLEAIRKKQAGEDEAAE